MYAGAPHWVPPLRRDEWRRFDRGHNPFFEHGDIRPFLALRDGVVVGRIAAIVDRLQNEMHRERTSWFGFFEASDAEAARLLLGAVERQALDAGHDVVRGPANPSLNESAGLLIDAFDVAPYVLMPYNPPSYASFIEAAGYRKAKDLLAWDIDLTAPRPARIDRLGDRVRRQHEIVVRAVNLQQFDQELATLQAIYRSSWEENWGFVPPTDAEIRQLAVDLKPILDTELLLFAERRGRPVGCVVAIPDANQVLKKMNGRLLPAGFIHFLRRRSLTTQARLLLLGVLPEVRRIGLYPLLIQEVHRRAVARGYRRAELSWTLEDNDAVNAGIEAAGATRYKTYRLYEKPIR